MKTKNLKMCWLGKGLKIFSKTRQRLYNEFLNSKSAEGEEKFKNYKNLF